MEPSLLSENIYHGWELMCALLMSFPPSKNFEAYLQSFIQSHAVGSDQKVVVFAKHCLIKLDRISKKGPRGKVPTIAEIDRAKVRPVMDHTDILILSRKLHFVRRCLESRWRTLCISSGKSARISKYRTFSSFLQILSFN